MKIDQSVVAGTQTRIKCGTDKSKTNEECLRSSQLYAHHTLLEISHYRYRDDLSSSNWQISDSGAW